MLGLIAAVILATAAPDAASADAAGPPTPAKAGEEPPRAGAKKKSSRDERVCWDRTPVGTRFSERVCATRGDLDERRQRDQDLMRTVRTAPTPNN